MKIERELMRGAGPTAVLHVLSSGERYGYELVEELSRRTSGVLTLGQSTLYPMLYNLEAKGLIKGTDRDGPTGRRRRYYALTSKGKKKLAKDRASWQSLADAMQRLGVIGEPQAQLKIAHLGINFGGQS